MQCDLHPNNKEFLTPNPFAPSICKVCLLGDKEQVAAIVYENDELKEPNKPKIPRVNKKFNRINPVCRKTSRQEMDERRRMLFTTGSAICPKHGLHDKWSQHVHPNSSKEMIACRICNKERGRSYYNSTIRQANYEKKLQEAAAIKGNQALNCKFHGEHKEWYVREPSGRFKLRIVCKLCFKQIASRYSRAAEPPAEPLECKYHGFHLDWYLYYTINPKTNIERLHRSCKYCRQKYRRSVKKQLQSINNQESIT